jgi:hypothetical protein
MDPRTALKMLTAPWLAFLAFSLNFTPPAFRPFEVIRTDGPVFRPNRRVEMDAYGAMSYRLAMPELRIVRHNVFTTDDAGFRNPSMPRPSIVVLGDSFIVGVGLSDEQTFPRALSRRLRTPVYNYGAQMSEAAPYYLADRRFGRGELLVYMPSEPSIPELRMPGVPSPFDPGPRAPRVKLPVPAAIAWLDHQGLALQDLNLRLNRDNGLQTWANEWFQRGRRTLLGNPHRIEVEGGPALVQTLDEQRLTDEVDDARFDAVLRSYRRFAQVAQERGGQLVVAPIPSSGSIYEDAFPAADRARIARPSLADRLGAALRAEGIVHIDLRPVFRANRDPYLYLRDDTHWDAHAVEIAAQHVAAELGRHGLVPPPSSDR